MPLQQPLYCIGWDYASPKSIPLKLLLDHAASPWKAAAIVHDEVWVPSVDGIPLMRTQDFLQLCRQSPGLHTLLNIKDSAHHKLWLRRAAEYGLALVDDGEIFQSTSAHLLATGNTMDLGVMTLPSALETGYVEALTPHIGALADETSRSVLRAYMLFLESGLLETLRARVQTEPENPISRTDDGTWMMSVPWGTLKQPGLAWEISLQRTSFLEQAILLGGGSLTQWSHAFSSPNAAVALREGLHLHTLLRPFGMEPCISWLDAAQEGNLDKQTPVVPYRLPKWKDHWILAHIDVPDPVPIIRQLASHGGTACLRIRLGHSPRQLVQLLQHFGGANLRLRCDRPGPLGLYAQLELNHP